MKPLVRTLALALTLALCPATLTSPALADELDDSYDDWSQITGDDLGTQDDGTDDYQTSGDEGYLEAQEEDLSLEAQAAWTRLGGADRYATMSQIVQTTYNSCDTAVLATGANFPDALTASALAGVLDCPIVLTHTDYLNAAAVDQLTRMNVKQVIVMGGPGAISEEVEASCAELGMTCTRIEGANRYDTAIQALRTTRASGSTSSTLIVATGDNYPDSLSVGPYAYATGSPILLVDRAGALPESAVEAVHEDGGFDTVILLGGANSVSDAVREQLGDGYEYVRLGGDDRYATSRLIAEFELENGFDMSRPSVTTGRNFPDALVASILNGWYKSPLLLSDEDGSTTAALLYRSRADIETGTIIGGTSSVPTDDPIADFMTTPEYEAEKEREESEEKKDEPEDEPKMKKEDTPRGPSYNGPSLNGVDISGWDKGIDLSDLEADFVIIKSTEGLEGTIYNPDYKEWADEVLAQGKLLGFYHYANGEDPVKEADEFYESIKDYRGRAVACLDWEGQGNKVFNTGKDVEWCLKFLRRIQELFGGTPFIYTSKNFTNSFDWSSVASSYPLWGAEYPDYEEIEEYDKDPWQSSGKWGAWGTYPTIFQYTSSGVLKHGGGIKHFDFNLFCGTREDWLNYQR